MDDPRVAMSAACKLAAETGEAWVSWRGERLKLGHPDLAEGGKDAVIVNRGRFYVVTLVDKDGLRVEIPAPPGKTKRQHRSAEDRGVEHFRSYGEQYRKKMGWPRWKVNMIRLQWAAVRAVVLERHRRA